MSKRLIQDLHAGISRRDWSAVENTANRLRDDMEKTIDILAGTGVGSLPNDYPLPKLAGEALTAALAVQTQQGVEARPASYTNLPVDAPIAFGLEAQGHIPAVEAALAEGAEWQEIGRRIGWDGETAKQYYERHLARSVLVDVPAVESEPVGYTTEWHLNEVRNGRIGNIAPAGTMRPENEVPVYAHPPRSLSNEGSDVIAAAQRYVDAVSHDPGARASDKAWRSHDKEKQDAFDALRAALSTRKGSSEGDGSATITSGGGHA